MESLRLYFIWYIFDIITISMIYSIPSMPGIRTWNADQHVRSTSRLGSLWSRPDPHPSFRRKARSRHKMWRGFPYSRRRNTCPWLTTLICPQVLRWNGICQSVIFFFFPSFPNHIISRNIRRDGPGRQQESWYDRSHYSPQLFSSSQETRPFRNLTSGK